MIIKDIGMLVAMSPRTRAYLQFMIRSGYLPNYVLLMDDENNFTDEFQYSSSYKYGKLFDLHKSIIQTLREANIPYEFCSTRNPNESAVIDLLKTRSEKYIIYSGPAGIILRKEILSVGMKFIHIHPGIVPEYKGSTPIYYSILKDEKCGATAFFMNEEIDSGDIIMQREFDRPTPGEDIDYYFDCSMRATLLKEILDSYVSKGEFPKETLLQNANEETYFIIHPVLKHIAILMCQVNN